MDSKSRETWLSIAAKSRLGAMGLIMTTVLVGALVVEPIWHPQQNDIVVTVPLWIAGGLAAGLMLFGIVIPAVFREERSTEQENTIQ
jgi:hypothetical protein